LPGADEVPAPDRSPRVIAREVTASPGEYRHGLHMAFPGAVQGGPERFQATYRGTIMEVELTPRAPRIIGQLSLPILEVRISFPAAGAEERAAMLARLDLATHRGGG
jgi:hypothetical protein